MDLKPALDELVEKTDIFAPVNVEAALTRFYLLLKRVDSQVGRIFRSVCVGMWMLPFSADFSHLGPIVTSRRTHARSPTGGKPSVPSMGILQSCIKCLWEVASQYFGRNKSLECISITMKLYNTYSRATGLGWEAKSLIRAGIDGGEDEAVDISIQRVYGGENI